MFVDLLYRLCLMYASTDCNCDKRGTVPNTQCDPDSHRCQCKVRRLLRSLITDDDIFEQTLKYATASGCNEDTAHLML